MSEKVNGSIVLYFTITFADTGKQTNVPGDVILVILQSFTEEIRLISMLLVKKSCLAFCLAVGYKQSISNFTERTSLNVLSQCNL